MIFVGEKNVEENLKMDELIRSLEEIFIDYANGEAYSNARDRIKTEEFTLNTMPALIKRYGIAGLKTYISGNGEAKFVVIVFDLKNFEKIAVIEANRLGQMRTGAVTALASKILFRERDPIFTLIGSGFQAETQLDGILTLFNPKEIRVYSRNFEHAREFVERNNKKTDSPMIPMKNVKDSLKNANLITCITNSKEPIFSSKDIGERYHINLAGANVIGRREVSNDVLEKSELIVVEHFDQSLKESSEIIEYLNKNGKEKVIELKDLVKNSEKYKNFKRTVFKSMGIGLEDLVAAYLVLKKMSII